MFGRGIKLFKLLGFEVRIDASWLIIVVLVVWSLARGLFPYYYKDLALSTYWWMGVLGALGLFGSIIIHELCHSLVARHFGLPMKGITLFVFGGVAEMSEEPSSPRAELTMAIAGPLASISIGLAGWGLVALGDAAAWGIVSVGTLKYLMNINFILAAFNLVPAFPLDGGRVLRAILWRWKHNLRWATRTAAGIGSGFGYFLIFFGIVVFISGAFISGIWWFLIGMFLKSASQTSYQQMIIRKALEGEPVSRFMKTAPVIIDPAMSLEQFVNEYIYKYHYKMFPVADDAGHIRCITTRDVREVPREQWLERSVGEVAQVSNDDNTLRIDTDAVDALAAMKRTGNGRFMVVDHNGKLAGVLTLKDLLHFLALKMHLEDGEEKEIEKMIER